MLLLETLIFEELIINMSMSSTSPMAYNIAMAIWVML